MSVGKQASTMDRLLYGPLLVLPYSARMHIVKAVASGQPVQEADWADLARAYASRQLHRCRILTLFALAAVAFGAVTAVASGPSPGDLGILLGAIAIWATSAPGWLRSHGFLRAMRR
jgi:hypothetical protein